MIEAEQPRCRFSAPCTGSSRGCEGAVAQREDGEKDGYDVHTIALVETEQASERCVPLVIVEAVDASAGVRVHVGGRRDQCRAQRAAGRAGSIAASDCAHPARS